MINKIIPLATFVLMSISFAEDWDGSTSKPTSKEIEGVPYYVITSPSELAWFSYQVNNKDSLAINARLGNDIHFTDDTSATSSTTWLQISNDRSKPFKGVIDGDGHTIYGVYGTYLIGYLDTTASFKNVDFRASSLTSFVNENNGLVSNVNNYGKLRNGFVEGNYGIIQYCKNIAKASDYRAGIAYRNSGSGIIKSCENVASNNSSSGVDSLGGISVINNGLIDSCKSNVVVDNAFANYTSIWSYKHYYSVRIGGIAAENGNGATIRNSSAKIKITKQGTDKANQHKYFGGIAAVNRGAIENVYNAELVLGSLGGWDEFYIGGIAGKTSGGTIKSVNSSVHIRSYSPYKYYNEGVNGIIMGGVLGELTSNGSVNEAFGLLSIDSVKGNGTPSPYNIGGLLGSADGAVISNSHSVVDVNFLNTSAFQAALLIGNSENSQILNSYSVGYTKGGSSSFAGLIWKNDSRSSVSNCYYDITLLNVSAIKNNESSSVINANGKTTTVMQSPAFVETLNTNAGLDDDSGMWQYCEGNYPILVSEGTCEEFYSKYGHQSSSSESSSSSIEFITSSSSSAQSSSSSAQSSSSNAQSSSSESVSFVDPSSVVKGEMTDSRDGQTYKTVTIGTQTWMAQNLNYNYNEGSALSICYNNDSTNCEKYGRLYRWSAAMDSAAVFSTTGKDCGASSYGDIQKCSPSGTVRGVCPEGWHLPSQDEWNTLFTAVGGPQTAGTVLKSTSGWNRGGDGTDMFSFSVLPAGLLFYYGEFHFVGTSAYLWSSSKFKGGAFEVGIYDNINEVITGGDDERFGASVRCLRDSVEGSEITSSSSSAQSTSSASSSSVEPVSSPSEDKSSSSVAPKPESSSSESSSSSVEPESSSSVAPKPESSSSAEDSNSWGTTTIVYGPAQAPYNISVNGMTLTLSNTPNGYVRIFDMLGHIVLTKPLSALGTTSIVLPTAGSYIVKVNGLAHRVNVK